MNIKLNIDDKIYPLLQLTEDGKIKCLCPSCQIPPQKPLPKTWEELEHRYIDLRYLPNKYIALRKLEILRDIYNDGWKADWENFQDKYIILIDSNIIDTSAFHSNQRFLHFRTPELRDEFLRNFAGLIEEARELL